jgi:hypothetical protein
MGYRSDVLIAVAFKDKEQRDEVWAVYVMDPRVQKHNLTAQWRTYDEGPYPVLWYEDTGVKWYENYEDVSGIEHLIEVASNFARERGHPYAAINYRVGEDLNDIETTDRTADPDGALRDFLWEMCNIERRLVHNFG